ncbi:MAG: LysR family transcriptional regulator, partial [Acidobacteriota bacterium]|nr:LysR family transcriptional regulator [Acidobacteriota bacterium]
MTRSHPETDLGALEAFVAIARLGTVGRAAEVLGRTQPSISARLAALEAAWETRLFRRGARGLS